MATGSIDFADVPRLAAQRELAARGITIRSTTFARPDLSIIALSDGDQDMAVGAVTLGWSGIAKGAPIVMVMEASGSRHVLATKSTIRTCRDLDGRRVAVNSLGATSDQVLHAYLAEACPDASPAILVMPQTASRTAALVTGTIDAAVIFRDDALAAMKRAPGRVHVLEDMGVRWPNIMNTALFVNRAVCRPARGARHRIYQGVPAGPSGPWLIGQAAGGGRSCAARSRRLLRVHRCRIHRRSLLEPGRGRVAGGHPRDRRISAPHR